MNGLTVNERIGGAMMITSTTVSLAGQVHGQLWWPADDGWCEIDERVDLSRFASRPTLRELVDHLTGSVAGNFRDGGRLTGDTLVTIEQARSTGRGTVRRSSRTYAAADLPSIADYVDADAMMQWEDE